jgi:hypothetical protein
MQRKANSGISQSFRKTVAVFGTDVVVCGVLGILQRRKNILKYKCCIKTPCAAFWLSDNQYYQNIKKTEVLNYEKLMMGVLISHHQLFMLYSCEA